MQQFSEVLNVAELATEIDERLRVLPSTKLEPIRAVRRAFSKRLAEVPPQMMIALALQLLEQHRFAAYELVCYHRAALHSLGEKELELFGQGIASWDSVDTFACYLVGPAWREHQVSDALIERWAYSTDRWWRRTALVCTVALNLKARGGNGDTNRTLQVCRLLTKDRDDMVVKAMSWALRELSRRDPQAVRAFLAEHEGLLAARVVREVQHKLLTGLKNPKK